MTDSISDLNAQRLNAIQNTYSQPKTKLDEENKNAPLIGNQHGPAFEIFLSDDAIAFMGGNNLTPEEDEELTKLFDAIDQIFADAGNKPLTTEQEKQLEALDKKLAAILGPLEEDDYFMPELSEEKMKELDNLFQQIDRIFETAGNKPLTEAQEKKLQQLSEKIDDIYIQAEEMSLRYAGLNDEEIDQVQELFSQIDKIFENAGEKPLTAEQEKQLAALDKKVNSILDTAFDDEDLFAELSAKDAQGLEGVFKQIDQLFETAGDDPLNTSQEKQLAALEDIVSKILEKNSVFI